MEETIPYSKIIAINGSPRKNGLTAALLKQFIKTINEKYQQLSIELIHLSDYKISHCTGCDICLRKPYECPLSKNDDMPKLEEKLKKADAIIIGSPSYFSNVPGILKDLIDRSRPLKMNKYQLKDKIFSCIVSAGLVAGGLNVVQNSLIQYALIQGMHVVMALGHPVIMGNFPAETLQGDSLKNFKKPGELGEIGETLSKNLAIRIAELLVEKK